MPANKNGADMHSTDSPTHGVNEGGQEADVGQINPHGTPQSANLGIVAEVC